MFNLINSKNFIFDRGLWIWRIEKFNVVPWPKEKYGHFYSGLYIVIIT
jgi:hypothetical protein